MTKRNGESSAEAQPRPLKRNSMHIFADQNANDIKNDDTLPEADPVVIHQKTLSLRVKEYIDLISTEHPFEKNLVTDKQELIHELIRYWPELPAWRKEASRVWSLILGVVDALPTTSVTHRILLQIRVSSESLPVATHLEPAELASLATFDGKNGIMKSCLVQPTGDLPDLEDMSVTSGVTVLCQSLPPLTAQANDTSPQDFEAAVKRSAREMALLFPREAPLDRVTKSELTRITALDSARAALQTNDDMSWEEATDVLSSEEDEESVLANEASSLPAVAATTVIAVGAASVAMKSAKGETKTTISPTSLPTNNPMSPDAQPLETGPKATKPKPSPSNALERDYAELDGEPKQELSPVNQSNEPKQPQKQVSTSDSIAAPVIATAVAVTAISPAMNIAQSKPQDILTAKTLNAVPPSITAPALVPQATSPESINVENDSSKSVIAAAPTMTTGVTAPVVKTAVVTALSVLAYDIAHTEKELTAVVMPVDAAQSAPHRPVTDTSTAVLAPVLPENPAPPIQSAGEATYVPPVNTAQVSSGAQANNSAAEIPSIDQPTTPASSAPPSFVFDKPASSASPLLVGATVTTASAVTLHEIAPSILPQDSIRAEAPATTGDNAAAPQPLVAGLGLGKQPETSPIMDGIAEIDNAPPFPLDQSAQVAPVHQPAGATRNLGLEGTTPPLVSEPHHLAPASSVAGFHSQNTGAFAGLLSVAMVQSPATKPIQQSVSVVETNQPIASPYKQKNKRAETALFKKKLGAAKTKLKHKKVETSALRGPVDSLVLDK